MQDIKTTVQISGMLLQGYTLGHTLHTHRKAWEAMVRCPNLLVTVTIGKKVALMKTTYYLLQKIEVMDLYHIRSQASKKGTILKL